MAEDAEPSIWRTAFGQALLAWLALCLLTSLGFVVLIDLVRYEAYPWVIAAVYLGVVRCSSSPAPSR